MKSIIGMYKCKKESLFPSIKQSSQSVMEGKGAFRKIFNMSRKMG